jgi:hypothetical protein
MLNTSRSFQTCIDSLKRVPSPIIICSYCSIHIEGVLETGASSALHRYPQEEAAVIGFILQLFDSLLSEYEYRISFTGKYHHRLHSSCADLRAAVRYDEDVIEINFIRCGALSPRNCE